MDDLEVTFADCLECGSIAEVVDEWTADSTDGPVDYRATLCLNRHRVYGTAPTPKE